MGDEDGGGGCGGDGDGVGEGEELSRSTPVMAEMSEGRGRVSSSPLRLMNVVMIIESAGKGGRVGVRREEEKTKEWVEREREGMDLEEEEGEGEEEEGGEDGRRAKTSLE